MLFLFALLTNLTANELTQENVKKFLQESDKVVLDKNVEKLAELLDENVDIAITVNFNGKNQITKLSKFEYLAKIKEGFTATQNYEYKILDRKIKIKNDIAYVLEKAEEKYTYNNQKVIGLSKVNNQIKLINNKLKFVKIEVILDDIKMDKI
jgi:predicted house-cleaning noncanonical NTP pyrophosphatase (MazG superfamily)